MEQIVVQMEQDSSSNVTRNRKGTQEYTKQADFSYEKIISKSVAAAGLCSWVVNILKYYDIFVVVEPKRKALAQATKDLSEARWPLMIDPQLQGVKWIKTRYGSALKVVRLSQRTYLDTIEKCISEGMVVLLENIGEH
ncbi:unnamed protein product [Acanthoscelides obtectus]|uniref:Dynein heavy chain coiled coil stalk domain-containing protein n=1 Tax=Acanthoscelides obtectus TaxID=200917 RepID=A0A9P0VU56_ACAOB|nr:unnamed protein product [Acanthoscelides obtectus]CAK1683881.1 hypothetical protein AOBTE_LOCUS34500 [Acanthoscelides obtectus]